MGTSSGRRQAPNRGSAERGGETLRWGSEPRELIARSEGLKAVREIRADRGPEILVRSGGEDKPSGNPQVHFPLRETVPLSSRSTLGSRFNAQ
jgi:hypothetical protein